MPLQPIERIMKEALGVKHHSEKNRAQANHNNDNVKGPADLSLTAGFIDSDFSPSMPFDMNNVTKIARSGSHTVQEFLTEFILFVTSEAHSKAQQ